MSCRLRGTGDVGVYLSGGFDSGAVAATAAGYWRRPTGGSSPLPACRAKAIMVLFRVTRIIDEAPYAAATAALYPNIEHVVVPNEGRSPLADLDRKFFLFDRPCRGICATGWAHSMQNAIRKRKLKVVLRGGVGNLGLSYDGMELLPELFRSGRWLHLWREASALVAARRMRWRGVLANTFGPWCPPALWGSVKKIVGEICSGSRRLYGHPP